MKTRSYLLGGAAIAIVSLIALRYTSLGTKVSAPEPKAPESEPVSVAQSTASTKLAPLNEPSASAPNQRQTGAVHKARYQSEILRLAKKIKLDVTDEQLVAAQAAYNAVFEARQQVESKSAKVTILDQKHYLIEIPPYPEQGNQLRETLHADFEKAMGADKSAKFFSQVGMLVSDSNNNWGAESQFLDVAYKSQGDMYEITTGRVLGAMPTKGMGSPTMVSESRLSPNHLLQFEYLQPLFPPTN